MLPEDIIKYCKDNLEGIVVVDSWGEQGVFYNPNGKLKRGIYILTVKEKDGENDSSSDLNRENTYRVNIGIRKNTFIRLFGNVPKRPAKGCTVEVDCDFTEKDKIMPHPVYAWMSWICCLDPSEDTFEKMKPFITEAYEYAKEKYAKKKV
ncbi:MAG: DUF6194 family protein [Peptostreptococcaceae bacterium]|nr:DUF6194 family protein [Peptostreptococcaceae bacterium]